MAAASPIHLLLINANAAVSEALTRHLGSAGLRYRLLETISREEFSAGLEGHRPDLIVAGESGVPGLTLQEVLDRAQKLKPALPVIVLGEHGRKRAALRGLSKGASGYLSVAELERLPSVIIRCLREQQGKAIQARLQNRIERAASLMQENQRLVAIGRLAGSIAHEINNPLESVTNLLYLMGQEAGLPAAARNYLTLAQRELGRAVQISKQTLNFYRESPARIPVRLSELFEEVLALYARSIAEKDLQVVREFGGEEPMMIFPGEMRQVFANLIGNAIEASFLRGKLRVRMRRSQFWGDSGIVGIRMTIADEGAGMTTEVRRRIGEPFFTTKGQGGTGLGLWVTQSIIQRYGGHLVLHSSTGQRHGTAFSLFLPTNLRPQVVTASGNRMAGASNSTPSTPQGGEPDDEAQRRLIGQRARGA